MEIKIGSSHIVYCGLPFYVQSLFLFHNSKIMVFMEPNMSKNKKVILRERKRHTDRGVSSTPYAVLSRGGGRYLGWGVGTLRYLLPRRTWSGGG